MPKRPTSSALTSSVVAFCQTLISRAAALCRALTDRAADLLRPLTDRASNRFRPPADRAASLFRALADRAVGRFPRLAGAAGTVVAFLTVKRLRRLVTAGALSVILAVAVALGCAQWVRSSADGHIYDLASVPPAPVALVLGAQVGPGGQPSAFLSARLEIARQLLQAGKVKAILVSGDHGEWAYDEPGAMQNWLVSNGVPADRIAQDHAGFDTYDSCVRANKIFGVRQAIVVTQDFHLPRAVTLCREQGIDASGVGDSSVRVFEQMWLRGEVREYGAAVKAAADVLTARDPIFLGPYETSVDKAVSRG